MKTLICIIFILLAINVFSQDTSALALEGGGYVAIGDTLQFVKGSIGGRQYKHVYINQSKMTKNTMLGEQFDNGIVWITDLKKKKIEGREFYIARFDGMSPFKVEAQIVEAIANGELKIISKRKF